MMDLGATICTPRAPACGLCPWRGACDGHDAGIAATLPRKKPKPARPTRHGVAFVVQRADGAVLVETRPDTGLLGGMIGPVCTPWTEAHPETGAVAAMAPIRARFLPAEMTARHVFTHFALELAVQVARVGQEARPLRGRFMPAGEARRAAPTALRKALDIGLDALRQR
jgi:A/G-specific adenine glycosylase